MRDSFNQQFFLMLSNKPFSQIEPATQINLVSVDSRATVLDLVSCT